MTNEPELLPCPFCGASGRVYEGCGWDGTGGIFHADCANDCEAGVQFTGGREEVATAWNRRAPAPAVEVKGLPTQREMNEAFYIDVCQAEDRLKEFIATGRKLLASLPAHWHDEAVTDLTDLCNETDAILNPHMHTQYQVEQATKRYGRAARATPHPAPAETGWRLVPQAAIDWLLGEGPDENGYWFGDAPPETKGMFWWRSDFRRMLAALPAAPSGEEQP